MGPVLFVLFIVVPIAELAVIIQVGQVIGVGWTILALVAVSLAGAALVKREGLRAWQRVREALARGRMPAAEVTDGALVLFAGALMLTPGFLTDALGLLLVIPLTRSGINRLVRGRVRTAVGSPHARTSNRESPTGHAGDGGRGQGHDDVVDVEVVDVERDRPQPDQPPEQPPESSGRGRDQ